MNVIKTNGAVNENIILVSVLLRIKSSNSFAANVEYPPTMLNFLVNLGNSDLKSLLCTSWRSSINHDAKRVKMMTKPIDWARYGHALVT